MGAHLIDEAGGSSFAVGGEERNGPNVSAAVIVGVNQQRLPASQVDEPVETQSKATRILTWGISK